MKIRKVFLVLLLLLFSTSLVYAGEVTIDGYTHEDFDEITADTTTINTSFKFDDSFVMVAEGEDIQTALNDIAASSGTVVLSNGNWTISASIQMPTGVTLQGSGWGSTILTAGTDLNSSVITQVDYDGATADVGIIVRDLQIDGNSANQSSTCDGIRFGSANNTIIENVWFEDVKTKGVHFPSSVSYTSKYLTVRNCYFNLYRDTAIEIHYTDFPMITANTMIAPTGSGNYYGVVLDHGCDKGTISNNSIDQPAYGVDGIQIMGSSYYNTIIGNIIDSKSGGVYISASRFATITGNTIRGYTYGAIEISSGDKIICTGNYLHDSRYGIRIADAASDNCIIGMNYVFGSGTDDILDAGTGTYIFEYERVKTVETLYDVAVDTATAPAIAGLVVRNATYEMYISTGTGAGAWTKIGSQ